MEDRKEYRGFVWSSVPKTKIEKKKKKKKRKSRGVYIDRDRLVGM